MRKSAQNHPDGFTLAELLVCLAVLAVLGAVAYHLAGVLMARQQVTIAADRLAASLALARGTALARRVEVALQPLDGRLVLDHGWQLVATNGRRRLEQDATVLSVVQLDAPCLSVVLRQTARASNVLRFAAVGYSRSEQGGFQAATFTLSCRGEQRQVRLGAQGRIRLCTPGHDKDCEASGEPAPP
ncbi:GspH/FimT family pseudopilin [Cupriavidus sp. WKF15]|uniref:GspH/FimT family pseudopilin n=1 Tax=Cupriavidus sp. WKF15 TaxID=3032282 RepID=UPI0023E21DDC|nr:GspH/FimT family pseudopilin [Cupriavidus sp. WKF15]WER45117.1 GspH/FimT family pseudopilin [Cupriavidus sp. WKF15]